MQVSCLSGMWIMDIHMTDGNYLVIEKPIVHSSSGNYSVRTSRSEYHTQSLIEIVPSNFRTG